MSILVYEIAQSIGNSHDTLMCDVKLLTPPKDYISQLLIEEIV